MPMLLKSSKRHWHMCLYVQIRPYLGKCPAQTLMSLYLKSTIGMGYNKQINHLMLLSLKACQNMTISFSRCNSSPHVCCVEDVSVSGETSAGGRTQDRVPFRPPSTRNLSGASASDLSGGSKLPEWHVMRGEPRLKVLSNGTEGGSRVVSFDPSW